jgi:hypothetical protein
MTRKRKKRARHYYTAVVRLFVPANYALLDALQLDLVTRFNDQTAFDSWSLQGTHVLLHGPGRTTMVVVGAAKRFFRGLSLDWALVDVQRVLHADASKNVTRFIGKRHTKRNRAVRRALVEVRSFDGDGVGITGGDDDDDYGDDYDDGY